MKTEKEKKKYNFTASGGGARVIPSLPGALLAFEQAGIEFDVVGGLSGGFLPVLLWRGGYKAKVVARLAIETNFASLLTLRSSLLGLLRAELLKRVYERTLPPDGIFGSHKLGEFFEGLVPELPDGCFTVAVAPRQSRNVPIVFTHQGVYEGTENGGYDLITSKPAQVRLIVRATSAIPGILEPIDYETESKRMMLFDGMLTAEGRCQISPITNLFGFERKTIIAFDVPEGVSWLTKLQDWLYHLTCRECYFPKSAADHTQGILVISPNITGIASVQFKVTQYPKLLALLAGYEAAITTLDQAGLLSPENRNFAKSVLADARALDKLTRWTGTEERIRRMKKLLADYDMYDIEPSGN